MKKCIITLAIIVTILSLNKNEQVVIPKTAIRFRIIANSNSNIDQTTKLKLLSNLQSEIKNIEKNSNTIEESRLNIKNSIPKIEKVVENTINNQSQNYNIDYGTNYFPEKTYYGITYPEGNYESLVINLGNGEGDNFWCVLFPPLCLLDAEESEIIEYKSLVKEIINKYF